MTAWQILSAVEEWSEPDSWLIRETIVAVDGRIDGILMPADYTAQAPKGARGTWTGKLRLVGVEAKASREDFMRGLREGQFERYLGTLGGLYIATGREIKTREIPETCGHLMCYRNGSQEHIRCVCKRAAPLREWQMDQDTMWRVCFWAIKRAREAEANTRRRERDVIQRLGNAAERVVVGAMTGELVRIRSELAAGRIRARGEPKGPKP